MFANAVCDVSPENVKKLTSAATKIGLENGLKQAIEDEDAEASPARRRRNRRGRNDVLNPQRKQEATRTALACAADLFSSYHGNSAGSTSSSFSTVPTFVPRSRDISPSANRSFIVELVVERRAGARTLVLVLPSSSMKTSGRLPGASSFSAKNSRSTPPLLPAKRLPDTSTRDVPVPANSSRMPSEALRLAVLSVISTSEKQSP